MSEEEELANFQLGDVLDLHHFSPKEIKSLIPDYIDECVVRGFVHVRIIHGKGKGVLRRIVHSALERHPKVRSFSLAGGEAGSWGATVVHLEPKE